MDELNDIITNWNSFSDKEDYYIFRNYWNSKYTNNIMDKSFIYETILLLKMCSNSMVRFNRKGEFNQGFRGLAKGKSEFFGERMKTNIVSQLNTLSDALHSRGYEFSVKDFKDILINSDDSDLIILDPPYILRADMYNTNFSEKEDDLLITFITNTKSDFIYFNYLESGGVINTKINSLFESKECKFLRFEHINDKTSVGQGRRGTKNVREVLITNIE